MIGHYDLVCPIALTVYFSKQTVLLCLYFDATFVIKLDFYCEIIILQDVQHPMTIAAILPCFC